MHWSGTASQHGIPGAMHYKRHLIRPDYIKGALGDGGYDMWKIRRCEAIKLLHHAVSTHMRSGAAGYEEQRCRIAVRGGEADNRIGRARTNRGTGGDRLASDAVVRIGNVDGALLVHHLDEGQLRYRIIESINHAPITVPRQ